MGGSRATMSIWLFVLLVGQLVESNVSSSADSGRKEVGQRRLRQDTQSNRIGFDGLGVGLDEEDVDSIGRKLQQRIIEEAAMENGKMKSFQDNIVAVKRAESVTAAPEINENSNANKVRFDDDNQSTNQSNFSYAAQRRMAPKKRRQQSAEASAEYLPSNGAPGAADHRTHHNHTKLSIETTETMPSSSFPSSFERDPLVSGADYQTNLKLAKNRARQARRKCNSAPISAVDHQTRTDLKNEPSTGDCLADDGSGIGIGIGPNPLASKSPRTKNRPTIGSDGARRRPATFLGGKLFEPQIEPAALNQSGILSDEFASQSGYKHPISSSRLAAVADLVYVENNAGHGSKIEARKGPTDGSDSSLVAAGNGSGTAATSSSSSSSIIKQTFAVDNKMKSGRSDELSGDGGAFVSRRRATATGTGKSTGKKEQRGGDQQLTGALCDFMDDDDLFLDAISPSRQTEARARRTSDGYTSYSSSAVAAKEQQQANSDESNAQTSQVQTIYFGGFFPWLTGDDESSMIASHDSTRTDTIKTNSDNGDGLEMKGPSASTSTKQHKSRTNQPIPSLAARQAREISTSLGPTTSSDPLSSGPILKSAGLPAAPGFTSSVNGFITENHHHQQLGRSILPAVRLALDHINKNISVLRNYRLEIVPRDTQCNATVSLKEFFDMIYEEPKKMLLYGDACRVSTDPIAKASYFFDLIQISYADTDPIYTIENYPNFFRVVPSENALSSARIPFIRHFNWTRVGTIYQNLPRYSLPHSKLLIDLERYNIVIKQSVSLPGSVDGLQDRDLGDELRKLKEKDVRIILGNFDEEWALLLFCEAFREKMIGRKYQWLLTGVSEDKLWQFYRTKGSSCSEQELLTAMDGYIITDITAVTRSQHHIISGMMAHEFSNAYKRRAQDMSIAVNENKFYGYVYDGIWAIALALDRVDSKLRYYNKLVQTGKARIIPELEGLNSLIDFDYHKPIWVKLIRSALNKTRFNGVTGTVSFHKNERLGLISFSQFQAFRGLSEVVIGSYDALNDELDLKVGFPIFWRGSSPPIDYTIQRVTPFRINRTLFIILSVFAVFGIALAFVFLAINIKFRNQRYIKMSSPYLNNLIIIGCILTYTSVIILGLDSGLTSEHNFRYICNARAWVLMAGFTLAFGSMFSKTFRVHSIFTNIKLHKKVIKDYKLFMVVGILLTLDICILIVWQYFDPFYRETNNGTSIQDSDNEDVIIVPEMEHCQSARMTVFLGIIYVYKGLLMAFGCFLAWETRHVSIPALNDSKYIGLSVYNVVIMCVIGASLSFVLRDQQDASFVIISIFIIFCSTTTLCLVFVPKVRMLIALKQNPRAGDQRVRATLKTFKKNYRDDNAIGGAGGAAGCRDLHGFIGRPGFGVNLNERIKILLDENVKQRSSLKEKTYELEALTYKYRKIQGMIQAGQYMQALGAAWNGSVVGGGEQSSTMLNTNPQSTFQLTSRSPTREKVSFENLIEDNNVAINNNNQSPQLELPRIESVRENDKSGLVKSSFMSSNTQLTTTTNTTSTTTNNLTTETTTDYSSGRLISSETTTSNHTNGGSSGIKSKRALLGRSSQFDSDKQTVSKFNVIGANLHQSLLLNHHHQHPSMSGADTNAADKKSSRSTNNSKHSPRYTTDSSYCSMGPDYELSGLCKSHEDLTLYPSSRPSKNIEICVGNFNRWSEGPFCTVLVRGGRLSDSSRVKFPGKAMRNKQMIKDKTPATGAVSGQDQVRASCPDLASKKVRCHLAKSSVPKRDYRSGSIIQERYSKSGTMLQSRERIPRTLSMIEYLGLDEFDLIARRHTKLMRQKAFKKGPSCCFKSSSSNCRACANSAEEGKSFCPHKHRCNAQVENDLSLSSDFSNSTDSAQSGSNISCSTCCSIYASQSFYSQYDAFDVTHSSSSKSICSNQSNIFEHRHDLSSSLVLQHRCRSTSQSSSQSSSSSHADRSSVIRFAGETSKSGAINQSTCQVSSQTKQSIHLHNHPDSQPNFMPSSSTSTIGRPAVPTDTLDPHHHHSACQKPQHGTDQAQRPSDQANKSKYSIKCDVLEEL